MKHDETSRDSSSSSSCFITARLGTRLLPSRYEVSSKVLNVSLSLEEADISKSGGRVYEKTQSTLLHVERKQIARGHTIYIS